MTFNLALLSALQPLAVLTLPALAAPEIGRTASGRLVKEDGPQALAPLQDVERI